MHKIKKKFFFSMHKMVDYNADTYAENYVYTMKVIKLKNIINQFYG